MPEVDVNTWDGFVLVGDNIDKNVKPRQEGIDSKTQSYHFFHSYAIQDRINLSSVSDKQSHYLSVPVNQLPLSTLLPSVSDHQSLIHNFSILISRVLVSEMRFFKESFDGVVQNHIKHEHYSEMTVKSEVVSIISMYICIFILYTGTTWCHYCGGQKFL